MRESAHLPATERDFAGATLGGGLRLITLAELRLRPGRAVAIQKKHALVANDQDFVATIGVEIDGLNRVGDVKRAIDDAALPWLVEVLRDEVSDELDG